MITPELLDAAIWNFLMGLAGLVSGGSLAYGFTRLFS